MSSTYPLQAVPVRRARSPASFSARQCDALFAAVLVNDHVDAQIALPKVIHLDYDRIQFAQCFRICRQLWEDGVDRAALIRMVGGIYRRRTLSAEEQVVFKHIRARFKHLRFAFANFDERHHYPVAFHRITIVMGHLQDAFKNGQPAAVARNALLLRLFLTKLPYAFITREIARFRPTTLERFRDHVRGPMRFIRTLLDTGAVTGREFHETRKIIGRQVALYDDLRTLYPSAYHDQISRYLSAINGRMGALHDTLIEQRINKALDYHGDRFEFPDEIAELLHAFVDRHPHTA